MRQSLELALSWVAPLGQGARRRAAPQALGRSLVGAAALAVLPGLVLAGASAELARTGLLPAGLKALILLLIYAASGGLRPLARLGLSWGSPVEEFRSGINERGALAAVSVVIGVLVAREALSVILGITEDISYPQLVLIAGWPVAGRWAAMLGAYAIPRREGADLLPPPPVSAAILSAVLVAVCLIALPATFFVAVGGALIVAMAGTFFAGTRRAPASILSDGAAGLGELGYLVLVAILSVQY